jgi:hypothetical protein
MPVEYGRQAHSQGLLRRCPIAASEFHLIGMETERGREQAEDISTLLPSRDRGCGISRIGHRVGMAATTAVLECANRLESTHDSCECEKGSGGTRGRFEPKNRGTKVRIKKA